MFASRIRGLFTLLILLGSSLQGSQVEWRGYFEIGGTRYFSLYDKSTGNSDWFLAGEDSGNLKVLYYDPKEAILRVEVSGEEKILSLGRPRPAKIETPRFLEDLDNPEFAKFIEAWMALAQAKSYWRKEESIFAAMRAQARILHNKAGNRESQVSKEDLRERKKELYHNFQKNRDFVIPRLKNEDAFADFSKEQLHRMLLFRVYGGRPLALPVE